MLASSCRRRVPAWLRRWRHYKKLSRDLVEALVAKPKVAKNTGENLVVSLLDRVGEAQVAARHFFPLDDLWRPSPN